MFEKIIDYCIIAILRLINKDKCNWKKSKDLYYKKIYEVAVPVSFKKTIKKFKRKRYKRNVEIQGRSKSERYIKNIKKRMCEC